VTEALVLLTVLALANAGIGALGSYVLDWAAESVVLDARRRLVAHLVWLGIPAVDRSEPGDLMARVTADTTLLREVTTGSLVSAVTNTLMLVATITVMALLDPLLVVVTVAVLGGAHVVTGVVVPRSSRAAAGAQESVGAMGTALERVLGPCERSRPPGPSSAKPSAWTRPPPRPGAAPAAVAFDQVRFRYRPELSEAHRGLSFRVPARG